MAADTELNKSLAFALDINGRRREHHADEAMARITAERLRQHLEPSGFGSPIKLPTAPVSIDTVRQKGAAVSAPHVELQVPSNYSFLRGAGHV